MRLSSIPLILSSYPKLIPAVLDQIKNPNSIDVEIGIKDSVRVLLERAAEIVPPEDPNSINLVETVLALCSLEPKLCGVLDKYLDLVDERQLTKILTIVLTSTHSIGDLKNLIELFERILGENLDFLDPRLRQQLFSLIIDLIADGKMDYNSVLAKISRGLEDKDSILLTLTGIISDKLEAGELDKNTGLYNVVYKPSLQLLELIGKLENELVDLLEHDQGRNDVIVLLRRLYKNVIEYASRVSRSERLSCELAKKMVGLVYKPLTDYWTKNNWRIASLVAQLFLNVYLSTDYSEFKSKMKTLCSKAIYHPWIHGSDSVWAVLYWLEEKNR